MGFILIGVLSPQLLKQTNKTNFENHICIVSDTFWKVSWNSLIHKHTVYKKYKLILYNRYFPNIPDKSFLSEKDYRIRLGKCVISKVSLPYILTPFIFSYEQLHSCRVSSSTFFAVEERAPKFSQFVDSVVASLSFFLSENYERFSKA